ncbi:MAG: hypothetical protein ABFC73_07585 [Clostridiaceae bacterium]
MKEMILIAVGGSGARVAQSVGALAAAGFADRLAREEARLTIRLVDIDINHEDGMELRKLVESYHEAFQFLWDARCKKERQGWRPLEIVLEAPGLFYFGTGFDGGVYNYPSIESYINGFINLNTASMPLVEALYGTVDLKMQLYDGCKGHPHVGALLWEHLYEKSFTPFWDTLTGRAGSPDPARIMFAGSLFGGTGASGVPTLAKCMRESLAPKQNWDIGLTLMAPYFYLNDAMEREVLPGEVEVDFSQFSFQSKLALNYYILEDVLPKVECIQVVGSDKQSMVDRNGAAVENKGDSTEHPQNDPAVPTELAAAIGIMQYFTEVWNRSVFVPKETIEEKHDWSMFPQADIVRGCLQQLERFCLMTRDYFTTLALLKNTSLAPTFIKEFWSESTRSEDNWKSIWKGKGQGIGALLEFSENMLNWFLEMDRNGLTVLSVDKYATILERKAKRGQTSGVKLHGVRGSAILGVMNQQVPRYFESREHNETPNNPVSDAYALALMDACETPYTRRRAK